MKILFVTRPIAPPWNEGSKNSVLGLARNMKGHEIHLLTAKGFSLGEKHIISEQIFSKSGLVSGRSLKQKFRLLKRLFRRDDIEICHFFFKPTPLVNLAARIAMFFSGKKTVQTIASMPGEGELLKQSIFSKNVVAGSELMQKFLKKEGFNARLIPFGIDLDEIPGQFDSKKAKKAFGFGASRVILFPGDLFTEKGLDIAVESMKPVIESFPNTKFVFACRFLGTKEEEENLEKAKARISELGLEKNTKFLGKLENMLELIKAADVVIFPTETMSYKMDYPLVLLEAMALGKPTIFSNFPPLNELFEKGSNIAVKPEPKEVASAVISLLSDVKKASLMGVNAKALVKKRFDIKNSAQEYLKLYKEILEVKK